MPEVDGELGWYKTAPEITLTADDGALGQVTKVEYRVDGEGDDPWTTYEGPFTVADPGAHVVEYRAIDAAGNVETTKRLAFRVDSSAPVPEATVEGDLENGPVEVTLDSSDGDDGLRHGADAVPRRRRPVEGLRGGRRRGPLRRLRGLAAAVAAGARPVASTC